MKFYLYNNLLSEIYTEHELKPSTVGEVAKELKLTGNFIFIVNDKVLKYPEDKDVLISADYPVQIKRVPKNATTQILGGTALLALGFIPGLQFLWGIGGSMIASGIASLFTPKVNTDSSAKTNYALTGGSNSIPNIGDKYPIVFGKHRIVPPLIGGYYSTLSSNDGNGDQYITALVCLGYNELSISDLQFGTNTLASNSTDVRTGAIAVESDVFSGSIEINQDGNLPSLYPVKMYEEQPKITITENETSNFTYVYTSPKKTKTIRAFISFAGFYLLNDEGSRKKVYGVFNMAFRAKGSSTWTTAVTKVISGQTINPQKYYLEHTFTPAQLAANPSGEWEVAVWRSEAYRLVSYLINGNKVSVNGSTKLVMTMTWDAFQCEIDDVPMIADERAKMCLLAFRMKATETNTGSLDSFNCIAQRLQPAWDGVNSGASGWTTFTKNSNPASAFLLALQGDHLPSAVADDRIDWTALEKLYTWCNSDNYQCNGIISEDETTRGVLDKILYTCRAYFYMKNGVYSFIHDNYQATPLCILTPEISSDFKATKSFEEKATALEITYNSAVDDWSSTSEQVYPYGESPAVGDTIDKITYWGVTNHEQVYQLARYQMAAMKLRPESYELKIGIEHFGLPLGSRVLLQHDVLSVGIDGGFIKSVDSATQITLRKEVPFTKLDTYAISIFLNDGSIITKTCDFSGESLSAGQTDTIVIDDTTGISTDDVFAYGLSASETIDCMVKAKTIESSPDLSATITLISYNEAIYTAAEYGVPVYDPKITKTGTYTIDAFGTYSTEKYSDNNGNSVQDDGAVFLTFEDSSIDGTTLVNMGSYKDISDSIPTNLVRSTDGDGNIWAVSSGTSLIPFYVDNALYNNYSINFFAGDLDLTTDGYICKYHDVTLSNLFSLRIESGALIMQLQLIEETIPITISGTGNSSMLSFAVDFENNNVYCYEDENLIKTLSIGTLNVIAGAGNQVIAGAGNNVIVYAAANPSNNNRSIYFNLLSTDATDGFVGKIRKFRIFPFALSSADVLSLLENETLLINVLAAGRYLGELTSAPTLCNTYDVFTYTGTSNVDFLNGEEYALNASGKWIIWKF